MNLRLLTLVITLSVGGFYIHSAYSDNEPDSSQKNAPSDSVNTAMDTTLESLENSLKETAVEIAKMIISKDNIGLLKYVDKEKWRVHYGGDLYKTFDEVKNDLTDSTSSMYCFLFNIPCYPGDLEKSIRDHLIEAKSKNFRVTVETSGRDPIFGTIKYEWDGKPEDLWVYKFPNPEFVYTEHGWKFAGLFAE